MAKQNKKTLDNELLKKCDNAKGDRDIVEINKLLLSGADILAKDPIRQNSVLHNAWGLDVIKFLIEKGADINAVNEHGQTPIFILLRLRDLSIIKYMVEKGANIHHISSEGTLLRQATSYEGADVFAYLLKLGLDANAKDENGATALHRLSGGDRPISTAKALKFAELLIRHGANVNQQDENGKTPLHSAIEANFYKMVSLLAKNGSDPGIRDYEKKMSTGWEKEIYIDSPKLPIEYAEKETMKELVKAEFPKFNFPSVEPDGNNNSSASEKDKNNLKYQIKNDLLKSFLLFANPKATGHDPVLPVSRVIFGAPGPVVSPPSFEFMGFGKGPKGIPFQETGGFDLSDLFSADPEEEEDAFNEEFDRACLFMTELLQDVADSNEFQGIPKEGPIVFALSIEDQINKVLGRIHIDGSFEKPSQEKNA